MPDPSDPASPAALTYAPPRKHARRAAAGVRDVADNPVLWRELRRPLAARRWHAVAGSILVVGMLLISYAVAASENALDDSEAQMGYAVVFNGLLWLLVAVVSATAIAQEKEGDTWTLLLTTPVRGATIVYGKAAGVLRRIVGPVALIVAHFLLFTVTGVISFQSLVLILWVMLSFNSVWIATGVHLSLRLKTVTFAVILNLMLAVLIYPVAAVLLLVTGALTYNRGERLAEQVAWYLPYSYLTEGTHKLNRGYYTNANWAADPGPQFWLPQRPSGYAGYNYRLVTRQHYLLVVFLVGCAYLAATAMILAFTARRFDRIVGRAPQREHERFTPAKPATALTA